VCGHLPHATVQSRNSEFSQVQDREEVQAFIHYVRVWISNIYLGAPAADGPLPAFFEDLQCLTAECDSNSFRDVHKEQVYHTLSSSILDVRSHRLISQVYSLVAPATVVLKPNSAQIPYSLEIGSKRRRGGIIKRRQRNLCSLCKLWMVSFTLESAIMIIARCLDRSGMSAERIHISQAQSSSLISLYSTSSQIFIFKVVTGSLCCPYYSIG